MSDEQKVEDKKEEQPKENNPPQEQTSNPNPENPPANEPIQNSNANPENQNQEGRRLHRRKGRDSDSAGAGHLSRQDHRRAVRMHQVRREPLSQRRGDQGRPSGVYVGERDSQIQRLPHPRPL